jgi:hypothetical protein
MQQIVEAMLYLLRGSSAQDFEPSIASATAWLFMASVQFLARRIAKL